MIFDPNKIFVFGSNEAGIHGAGAAKTAWRFHGATLSTGVGLSGNSYAIPTKDRGLRTLPLDIIQQYVNEFVTFAQAHPDLEFKVTRIGCGLAGLQDEQVAPMFSAAPANCHFDEAWKPWLNEKHFCGTYSEEK